MHDAGKILAGLVVFLALVTTPLWYHSVTGTVTAPPELEYPAGEDKCVADKEYMTSFHMDLLNEWRDDVVRRNDRVHKGLDGIEYDKSLSRTCMNCHVNKDKFCDRCHDYAGVKPYCWDCHLEPEEKK